MKKANYIKKFKIKYVRKRVKDDILNKPVASSKQVYTLFKHMQDETKEKVVSIHLNTKLSILSYEVVSIGTIRTAQVYPIEVFRNAMLAGATSVIIVHNHPSGDCTPSNDDRKFAKKLFQVSKLLEIELEDFIIIGYNKYTSFKDERLIRDIEIEEKLKEDLERENAKLKRKINVLEKKNKNIKKTK